MTQHYRIQPRSGAGFLLAKNERLRVIDPEGSQVSDLLAFSAADPAEVLSNGRTFDYEETLKLTTGNGLWSNRSNPMLTILDDTAGTHDFLLTPCSTATFEHFYPDKPVHQGCFGNLAKALEPFGISADAIPVAFNVFMNVPVNGATGKLEVLPPTSKAGDYIVFEARMDLIIGLTACSAYASNGGSFRPIDYQIEPHGYG